MTEVTGILAPLNDKNIGSFLAAAFLYAQPVRMNVLPGKFNA